MFTGFKDTPHSSTPSRAFADFLMVHTSLIAALAASWIRVTRHASPLTVIGEAETTADQFVHLYLPLSLIFPAAFLLSRTYSDHTGWSLGRRAWSLLAGLAMGLTGFCSLSLAFLTSNSLGPRSLMLFSSLLLVMLISARAGEWALLASLRRKWARRSHAEEPVLVIGGAGYIGSSLVSELLRSGRKVRVLDSLLYGDGPLREVFGHEHLELMVGDCRNLQTVIRAVNGVDAIVHLAAIVGDPACEQDRQAALETNYAATRMLVEVAKGQGISRFIFASSCSVYGASDHLMNETSPTVPVSLYGQTKIDSERALLNATDSVFRPTILRLATVFGLSRRPRFDLVVNLLTAKAASGHAITVFNGDQWRPFIHVTDIVRGILLLLESPIEKVGGEVFNLGDNRLNHTLTEVANKIAGVFPQAHIESSPTTDRRNYRVSFDKVRNRIGFECSKDLEFGIREIQTAFTTGAIRDYSSYQYNNQKFLSVSGCPGTQGDIDEKVMAAFAELPVVGASFAIAASAGVAASPRPLALSLAAKS